MLQRPKNFIENRGEMLQRSDISKKMCIRDRLGAVFFGKQGAAVFVIALVFAFCHRQLPCLLYTSRCV